jgi:hypothetical protein
MYISHLFVVTFYSNLFPPRSFSYISDDRGRRFLLSLVARIALLSESCSTEDQIEETIVWFLTPTVQPRLTTRQLVGVEGKVRKEGAGLKRPPTPCPHPCALSMTKGGWFSACTHAHIDFRWPESHSRGNEG